MTTGCNFHKKCNSGAFRLIDEVAHKKKVILSK
jgi:hypothetical protein